MKKFNSSKWITENKHGIPSFGITELRYDNPFDKEEEDPKNPMGLPGMEEVEKDPDAQVAEPKVAPKKLKGKKPEGEKKDFEKMRGGQFGDFYPDAMKGGLRKQRANMPQVPADDFETDLESPAGDGLETNEPEKIPNLGAATKAYLNSSDDTGPWPKGDQVNVSPISNIPPTALTPTQADIYMDNAFKKVASAETGEWVPWGGSVLASSDMYILDGHHRWAATIVYNDKHGTDHKMSINKVAMPIDKLLKVANAYTDAHPDGVRQSGGGTATENQDPRSSLYEKIEKLINKNQ